jgi:hypothetical protein
MESAKLLPEAKVLPCGAVSLQRYHKVDGSLALY